MLFGEAFCSWKTVRCAVDLCVCKLPKIVVYAECCHTKLVFYTVFLGRNALLNALFAQSLPLPGNQSVS